MLLGSKRLYGIDSYPCSEYDNTRTVHIPAIAINSADTSTLVQEYLGLTETNQVMQMEIEFRVHKTSGVVLMEFWFQTIDMKVLGFLHDFKPFRDKLGSQVSVLA